MGEGLRNLGPEPGAARSVARKREVVLRLLRGEFVGAVPRELGVEIYRLEKWRGKWLSAIDAGSKIREVIKNVYSWYLSFLSR